ncbi:G1 family glutamic endopeptidase [Amycolatopsis sp. VS8301801F10]|uniref:G1 family glutamic endopeptidase n=1 Tax=Amycolatopsis sp. VS8301801F10 TaxID=2652442 RepID=UPI0038FCA65A
MFAPWVGIDGDGSSTVEQTGVATDCSSGSPQYQAWYEMYPAAPVYYSASEAPVKAGDHITATVTRSSNSYKLDLRNDTQGWTKTTTQSLNAKHSSAEAIIESPTDSYPAINGGVKFDGVKFDGKNLVDTSPQGLNADDGGSATWVPGPIGSDGQSFSMNRQ